MNTQLRALAALITIVTLHTAAASANAQFNIPWSTIDGGGGISTGGTFELTGTIGQADAFGVLNAPSIQTEITPGYWAAVNSPCEADFNNTGTVSVQDIFDFLEAYFTGATAADVNGSGSLSVQDLFDFLAAYFRGC